MAESKEENNSQLAAAQQTATEPQAQPCGRSGILTLSKTLGLAYLGKQTLAEATCVVFITFVSLGLNIWNKQLRRRRGRICFNSWFGEVQPKVACPHPPQARDQALNTGAL